MADKAHAETDAILADMEKHLSAIYTRAGKENQKKARDFFKQFNRLDKQHKADVQSGKWTEEQYQEWKKNKMLYSQRFNHLKEQISADLVNTNKTALNYINNQLPEVYAINYNALDGEIAGYSFELTDAETVKNLATTDKSLLPYKELDETKDIRWNTKHINAEVLQGILQGDSMDEIAKRFQKVTNMDEVAAIRNARTTVTGAENIGRLNSYKQAQKDGIRLQKEWLATNDGRTRHAHALLNGQVQDVDKPFKSEFGDIMFPADPTAHPANVYNCRCTLVSKFLGFGKEVQSFESYYQEIKINGIDDEIVDSINKRFMELDSKYHAVVKNIKGKLVYEQEEYDLYFENYVNHLLEQNPKMRKSTAIKRTKELLGDRPEKIDCMLGGEFYGETKLMTLNEFSFDNNVTFLESAQRRKNSFERFKKREEEGKRKRALGNVNDGAEGTFIHEYGHAIDYTYGIAEDKRFLDFYETLTEDDVKFGISDYATTDAREFIAESFAESFFDDQRPISKKFMVILEEIVNDKLK